MNIPALQPKIQAADLPLERLAGNTRVSEEQKIAEVSRQFEAVLVGQILREAQKPVFPSKFTDTSIASGIYQDLATTQLADAISRSGSFGLAGSLNQQLTRQTTTHD